MVRFVVTAVLASACTSTTPTENPREGADKVDEVEIPATPAIEIQPGFFTADWALWKSPTDERNIPNPDGEGTVKNYISNVERGRPLERIGEKEAWSHVRIDDGTEGWIKTERIVTDEGAHLATVVEETRMYKRADLLALVIEKKVPAGALIIAAGNEGKFIEVDYPSGKYDSERTWVEATSLVTDASEIEAARFIRRILQLRADGKADAAAEFEDLARGQFVGSKLLPLLDVEEPPPGEEGAEPEAGE